MKVFEKALFLILRILNKNSKKFNYSIKIFPKTPTSLPLPSVTPKIKIGIIIQGPVNGHTTFLNALIKQLSFLKDLKVIVSTWNEEPVELIKTFSNSVVITSEFPSERGYKNLNLQYLTTKAGIEKLGKVDSIIKLRTDVRIYNIPYLIAKSEYSKRNKKILVPTFNTYRCDFRWINDMIQIGEASLMQEYWSNKEIETVNFSCPPEIQLSKAFFKLKGIEGLNKKDLLKYFDFFDWDNLGVYWGKYSHIENYNKYDNKRKFILNAFDFKSDF